MRRGNAEGLARFQKETRLPWRTPGFGVCGTLRRGASSDREAQDWPLGSSAALRVAGHAPRVVHGEHVGRVSISSGFSAIDISESLAVSVQHFIAAGYLLD